MDNNFVLAIHGGAGTILKSKMTAEKETAYNVALKSALAAGYEVLKNGGNSLDAVERAVIVLEDSDLFNAGKGSVFTSDGSHEMEASMMCGATLNAGAVAGVRCIKNPVILSRRVLDNEDYVYLSGEGAHLFAKETGLECVEEEYFYSDLRYQQWQSVRNSTKVALDHSDDRKFGTVGAVALDQHGNLAAATSTGGLTNKRYGRIGDSSVIGAGTYANNHTCAISCTGYGEYFLRGVVAYDISCLMEYAGMTLQEAAEKVILEKQVELGGEGGIIGVDAQGNSSLVFNSEGMYRGVVSAVDHQFHLGIYGEG
ncbi:Isoaspartyl aminopeptidase [Fulvivirga imtechensis AK7]|uniref:Isoaspartyl peptidase n=1 Tax=Fulvivirga imtechensis AK7 TaxID=1237149 RepID=L8JSR5_9BACT|nr:isoaspartyl peptidase/L-asparaginase [Fulvivirga imtechensis]ELR70534.1 Isoaspartyl aminopeptidase [Fulvivirga imtechensis AK7]